jgi:hypothetical protein
MLLLVGMSVSLGLPPLAAAQSGSTGPALPADVYLQITPCPSAPYDTAEFTELLRVELRGMGVTSLRDESELRSQPGQGTLAVIHLGCGGVPATLAIELADLIGGSRVSRELVIDDVQPTARARALSIAVASLLESSWSLLATRPAGAGPTPMPESVRQALRGRLLANLSPQPSAADELPPAFVRKPAAPLSSSALALSASLAGRAFPSRSTGLTGLDLAVAAALSPGGLLRLAFDFEGMYGRQLLRDAGGPAAQLENLWLSAGVALFVSAHENQFQLGPLLRVAYARVLASTSNEDFVAADADGWVFMFGLSSVLRFELTPSWDLYLGTDIAYVPGGLIFRADTSRAVSFADLSLALRLGVSVNL